MKNPANLAVDGIIMSITAKKCLALIMPQQPPLQEPQ